jgi:PAS domain-containing protein
MAPKCCERSALRKNALEPLAERSETLYETVAETASDAIVVIDEDSTILFMNHPTERIFGYSKEELLGQQLTMLMPDYLRQAHKQSIKKYIETGEKHLLDKRGASGAAQEWPRNLPGDFVCRIGH